MIADRIIAWSLAIALVTFPVIAGAQSPQVRQLLLTPPRPPAAIASCSPGTEAAAFLARTSGLNGAHTDAYCTLINGLVADGIFAKQDAIYIFATDTTTNALLSLVSATYNGTATGAPTFTADAGYTGASGKYVDTNFNPTTASSPKMTQNSASAWVWSNTSTLSTNAAWGQVSGTGNSYIYPRFTGDVLIATTNDSAYRNSGSITDGSGLTAANRTASNATQRYKNGSSVGSNADVSNAFINANNSFLRGDGTAYTGQVMAGGFGQSLNGTEHANLYARVHTYLQTIAGIP